jgi:uncharacterized membrane protein YbhN (UPF0104 family)
VRKLREHHIALTLIAFGIAAAAVVAIAAAFGFDAFADAWTHPHFGWLALALAGWALAVPAYALAYRTLAQLEGGSKLPLPLVLRVVIAGFGPFRPGGGFVLDHHALNAVEGDEDAATIRVLGLGALEWALLAPAACVCAIVLLAIGDHRPMSSLLWPWALAVPAGFAIGLWLAVPARRERIGKRWSSLGRTLHGVGILRDLGPSCWLSWSGIALYWALDIASFYGAVRFIGVHPNLGETILAYATGYALTRRSMPFGGAGVTEVLMTFALHWVGEPVATALACVVVYRFFNFVLPTVPAFLVRDRVRPLVRAAEDGRTAAAAARRKAAAPLGSH